MFFAGDCELSTSFVTKEIHIDMPVGGGFADMRMVSGQLDGLARFETRVVGQ